MKKTVNKNQIETIWQKNGIPPLEYCSLDRATRLLGCEIGDLYHWHNTSQIRLSADLWAAGNLFIKLSDPELQNEMILKSKLNDGGEAIHSFISDLFIPGLTTITSLSEERYQKDGMVAVNCLFNGLLRVSSMSNAPYKGKVNLSTSCYKKNEAIEYLFVSDRDYRYNQDYQYETEDIEFLVDRKTIEKIHKATLDGSFTHSYPFSDMDFEESSKDHDSRPRAHVSQFSLMYSLLQIAGFSNAELKKYSGTDMLNKLKEIEETSGVKVPRIDKNTYDGWLGKIKPLIREN